MNDGRFPSPSAGGDGVEWGDVGRRNRVEKVLQLVEAFDCESEDECQIYGCVHVIASRRTSDDKPFDGMKV